MSEAAHTIAATFRIELPKLVARFAQVVRAERSRRTLRRKSKDALVRL